MRVADSREDFDLLDQPVVEDLWAGDQALGEISRAYREPDHRY